MGLKNSSEEERKPFQHQIQGSAAVYSYPLYTACSICVIAKPPAKLNIYVASQNVRSTRCRLYVVYMKFEIQPQTIYLDRLGTLLFLPGFTYSITARARHNKINRRNSSRERIRVGEMKKKIHYFNCHKSPSWLKELTQPSLAAGLCAYPKRRQQFG